MVKPKWNRGYTRIMLNANGLQASESVKLVFMAFLFRKLNYLDIIYVPEPLNNVKTTGRFFSFCQDICNFTENLSEHNKVKL